MNYNTYLIHYGVKGMKWGVVKEKPSWSGRKLSVNTKPGVNKSKNRSTSSDAEEVQQKKKIITGKRVAITLAVAGGLAVGGYIAHDKMTIGRLYRKELIKSGSKLANVSTQDLDLNRPFYSALSPKDKRIYRVDMPEHIKRKKDYYFDTKLQSNIVKATKDLKIANKETQEKVFRTLVKSDKDFSYLSTAAGIDTVDKFVRKLNTPVGINAQFDQARNNYYNILKLKGYAGVLDLNDASARGWGTKTPTIIFDASNLTKQLVKQIGDESNPNLQYLTDVGITITRMLVGLD